jgi:hypothetical protein
MITESRLDLGMKRIRKRCHNCIFAGEMFRIIGKGHLHCTHPNMDKPESWYDKESRSPWDSLREFWDTCDEHKFKEK